MAEPVQASGARKISTSSWTIRCQGSPRARALRMLSSWKNDGRGIRRCPRSPASSATHREVTGQERVREQGGADGYSEKRRSHRPGL
jgi:hypothetical protein